MEACAWSKACLGGAGGVGKTARSDAASLHPEHRPGRLRSALTRPSPAPLLRSLHHGL